MQTTILSDNANSSNPHRPY